MKKAQAANEAAIVIGLMTMFLIIFIAVMADQLLVAIDGRATEVAGDLSLVINSEFLLANRAEEGYSRTFEIPPNIRGRPYTLVLDEENRVDDKNLSQLVLTIEGLSSGNEQQIVKVLPENVSGTIETGTIHCITKSEGKIRVYTKDNVTTNFATQLAYLDLTNPILTNSEFKKKFREGCSKVHT